MTLIVGAHLGDGVGIMADTRVTLRREDGRTAARYDDCQKLYVFPSLIVGVAGDVTTAAHVLHRVFENRLRHLAMHKALALSSDPNWLRTVFQKEYQSFIREERAFRARPIAYVLASEDFSARRPDFGTSGAKRLARACTAWLRRLKRCELFGSKKGGWGSELRAFIAKESLLASLAEALANVRSGEAGTRLVAVLRLPGADLKLAKPGQAVCVGSGATIEHLTAGDAGIILPGFLQADAANRFSCLSAVFNKLYEKHADLAINNIVHALVFSEGNLEPCYFSVRSWPSDSAARERYMWEVIESSEVPKSGRWTTAVGGRYSVHFERRSLACFIVDHQEHQRLWLRPIFDLARRYPLGCGTAAEVAANSPSRKGRA